MSRCLYYPVVFSTILSFKFSPLFIGGCVFNGLFLNL